MQEIEEHGHAEVTGSLWGLRDDDCTSHSGMSVITEVYVRITGAQIELQFLCQGRSGKESRQSCRDEDSWAELEEWAGTSLANIEMEEHLFQPQKDASGAQIRNRSSAT